MTRTDYAEAYRHNFSRTIRFLCSRGVSSDTAEESAQAAWAKGWEKRHELRRRDRIVQWVNTIALNIFRGRYREQSREEELPEQGYAVQPRDPGIHADLEKGSQVCSNEDWKLLHARYVAGVGAKEISDKLDVKPVTVRVRLLRAKRKVRRFLSGSQT